MPLYPPRLEPVRKKEILGKRMVELNHALKNELKKEKIDKAAEAVRHAQMILSKAKIEAIRFLEETDQIRSQIANAKRDEEMWLNMPVAEIIRRHGE